MPATLPQGDTDASTPPPGDVHTWSRRRPRLGWTLLAGLAILHALPAALFIREEWVATAGTQPIEILASLALFFGTISWLLLLCMNFQLFVLTHALTVGGRRPSPRLLAVLVVLMAVPAALVVNDSLLPVVRLEPFWTNWAVSFFLLTVAPLFSTWILHRTTTPVGNQLGPAARNTGVYVLAGLNAGVTALVLVLWLLSHAAWNSSGAFQRVEEVPVDVAGEVVMITEYDGDTGCHRIVEHRRELLPGLRLVRHLGGHSSDKLGCGAGGLIVEQVDGDTIQITEFTSIYGAPPARGRPEAVDLRRYVWL